MNMSSTNKDPAQAKPMVDEDRQSVAHGTILGGDVDDAVLRANGHSSDLKRQFSWISALGLGFSITNSWAGYLSNFGQNLVYGGPQTVLFGLIVAWVVQFIISLGLGEIASAFPSAGGQYHFCFILSPEKHKRFTAYIVGWMSMLAWWIVTCSGVSLCAIVLAGMISFIHPQYVAQGWHIYLYYAAMTLITTVPIFVASKRLAYVVQAGLFISVFGMIVCLLVPVGMHKHANHGSFLVESGLGISGWSSGTAWLLSISNSMYAFGGTDGAIHISEEMSQAGRRVPQVMIMTMIIGLLTSFPLFLALMYFMTDLDAVRLSPLSSMEIMYQATGSRNVTIFLIVLLEVVYMVSLSGQWVTCGRIAWALARDNGVPFPNYFTKIDRRLEFPVRTTVVAIIFVLLYGLLYLASTTAFNSIITSAVLFLNITYSVPQGIILFQGRKKHLPPRYLNLGWVGYCCNAFSISWIVVLGVSVCMPPSLPVAIGTMNYSSVVVIGLFSIILGLWFFDGKKNFTGPRIDWDLIKEANRETLKGQSSS